jgi:hypothetical protein
MSRKNVLHPDPTVLVKLGSIAVHISEALSEKGHPLDAYALKSLIEDPEIKEWLKGMDKLAMLPVKR